MAPRSLLVACLWLTALPALGEGVRFVHPSAGMTLAAGDEVMVRWSGGPEDAEEMELMLSVDGGRHFSVRLTHELEGDTSSYLWRVPNLPSNAARIGLRANLDGREVEVGESAPFAITAGLEAGAAPTGSIRFMDGEIWWLERVVAGSEGERPALAGLDPMPPETHVLPAAGEWMLADLPPSEGVPRPTASSTFFPAIHSASLRQGTPHPLARTPLLLPLRI